MRSLSLCSDRMVNTIFINILIVTLSNALKIQMQIFEMLCHHCKGILGPVVQSIVSLTSSLRGQLVKCITTLLPNTLIFLLKK